MNDPWLALRGTMFPERYGSDAGAPVRQLDWPGHPDLTLIAEDFAEFLDGLQEEADEDGEAE